MIKRHLPLVFGLLTTIMMISSAMLIFRLLGFNRGDALYFACLTFAVIAYFSSRRAMRKFGRG